MICWLLGHRPALVVEPCRCRRCGEMIRWNDQGGWRLTRRIEYYPRTKGCLVHIDDRTKSARTLSSRLNNRRQHGLSRPPAPSKSLQKHKV